MGQTPVTTGPKNQRGIAAAYEHPRVTNETNRKPTETKTSTEITSPVWIELSRARLKILAATHKLFSQKPNGKPVDASFTFASPARLYVAPRAARLQRPNSEKAEVKQEMRSGRAT